MTDSPDTNAAESEENVIENSAGGNSERRSFLVEAVAITVGGVISLFGLIIGVVPFLDPLRKVNRIPLLFRKENGGGDSFVRVASIESVPDDGVPRRFPVIADLVDCWTFSPNQPIGAVWLRRKPGEQEIQVFHSTCPHAGCSVSYRPDPNPENCFYHCPCHNSAFNLDGEKIDLAGSENPSPRPMDTLNHRVDESGNIFVQFENFYTGIHEKKARI